MKDLFNEEVTMERIGVRIKVREYKEKMRLLSVDAYGNKRYDLSEEEYDRLAAELMEEYCHDLAYIL